VVAVSLLVLVSTLGPLMAANLPEAVSAGFACLAFLAALTIAVFLPQALTPSRDGQQKRG
jgi:cyanate permease